MRKLALLLLAFFSLAFAGWETTAVLAIVTGLTILALFFMLGHATQSETLTFMAKDELYQLLAVAILVGLFAGSSGVIDLLSKGLSPNTSTLQAAALASLKQTLGTVKSDFSAMRDADNEVGIEASKGLSCNVMGVGYFVSGCGGYAMLQAPFSLVGSIFGFAIGELSAIIQLITLSDNYALTLILPFGILLRTFKITRGAGGLLLGLAISMHLLLPAGIIFTDYFSDAFLKYDGSITGVDASIVTPYKPGSGNLDVEGCTPGDTGTTNEDGAIETYDAFRDSIRAYLYNILMKATLGPVIALLMFVGGIRAISALGGAEIDVSALGRVV
jgi:hypothetical protein